MGSQEFIDFSGKPETPEEILRRAQESMNREREQAKLGLTRDEYDFFRLARELWPSTGAMSENVRGELMRAFLDMTGLEVTSGQENDPTVQRFSELIELARTEKQETTAE